MELWIRSQNRIQLAKITGDRCFDLEPINSDVYVYEMPKE